MVSKLVFSSFDSFESFLGYLTRALLCLDGKQLCVAWRQSIISTGLILTLIATQGTGFNCFLPVLNWIINLILDDMLPYCSPISIHFIRSRLSLYFTFLNHKVHRSILFVCLTLPAVSISCSCRSSQWSTWISSRFQRKLNDTKRLFTYQTALLLSRSQWFKSSWN